MKLDCFSLNKNIALSLALIILMPAFAFANNVSNWPGMTVAHINNMFAQVIAYSCSNFSQTAEYSVNNANISQLENDWIANDNNLGQVSFNVAYINDPLPIGSYFTSAPLVQLWQSQKAHTAVTGIYSAPYFWLTDETKYCLQAEGLFSNFEVISCLNKEKKHSIMQANAGSHDLSMKNSLNSEHQQENLSIKTALNDIDDLRLTGTNRQEKFPALSIRKYLPNR